MNNQKNNEDPKWDAPDEKASKDGRESDSDNRREEKKSIGSTRKYIMWGVLGVLIIAASIYGWNWYQFAQAHESTDNAQIDGDISPVIPRVEGYVQQIKVDDNEKVKKGQLLLTIDPSDYNIQVTRQQAALKSAQAAYEDAEAGFETAQVEEDRAQVALEQAETKLSRQQRLFNDHSTTKQNLDNANYAFKTARAQRNVSEKKVNAAKVKMEQALANIEEAQSTLDNANLQLSYTQIKAPIAGRVSKKDVEPGQFIRPGNPVMAIANDSTVWVVANFKEGQIAQIDIGQHVDVEVDAYPDTAFDGTVQSLGGATGSKFALLPPDNASGNFVKVEQRIPVKITFDSLDQQKLYLKPGMNAIPTVQVKN